MQTDVLKFAMEMEAQAAQDSRVLPSSTEAQEDLDDKFGAEVQPLRTLGAKPRDSYGA